MPAGGRKRTALCAAALLALGSCLGARDARADMWINSPDVGADGQLAAAQAWNADGCGGANRSPALRWGGETPATRGFALVMMDVESRKGFRQWLVFNIPAGVHSLPAGAGQPDGKALPAGAVQSENDYGAPGYGGPCPPAGKPITIPSPSMP